MSVALDFQIRFVDGRGLVGLRDGVRWGLCDIARLDLEVPNLRFPFDAGVGVARFASRRCLVDGVELRLDEGRLGEHLRRQPLDRFGLHGVDATIGDGAVRFFGTARVGERQAAFSAVLLLGVHGERGLAGVFTDIRLFGFLPAPAPLLGVGLALGMGATADDPLVAKPGPAAVQMLGEPAVMLRGLDRLELDPLALTLAALPHAGWRLPRSEHAVLRRLTVERGAIGIEYGAGVAAARVPAERAGLLLADRLLQRGELGAALEAYAALGDDDIVAATRRLAVLASLPPRFDEAEELAARILSASETATPQLLLALVLAERGRHGDAADRYLRAAAVAERAGETADALEARLRGAEEALHAGRSVDVPWLERLVGEHPRAAEVLSAAYAAEKRWRPLVQLERRLLSRVDDLSRRLRLAEILLDELEEPARAKDELDAILATRPDHTAALSLLARTLERLDHPVAAASAFARAAAALPVAAEAAESWLHAARLVFRAGHTEDALGHVEAALARAPSYPPALAELATVLLRLGRVDDALSAYQRAAAAVEEPRAKVALLHALALLYRDELHDHAGARLYVEQALATEPSVALLELGVELAASDGRHDDQEQLLADLAALGDRRAALERARLLLQMGRPAEAAEVAERLGTSNPDALEVIVEARHALGQTELLREALEQRVATSGDNQARLRLGRLLSETGDLPRARQVLQEALAGVEPGRGEAARREVLELSCDVLMRLGDDAALEVALGRLARARPLDDPGGRARALAAQGAARSRLGLTAEAADSFQMALALDPDNQNARAGLGEAAFALRRWNDARAALEVLHDLGLPPRVDRALRLGEIAERQEDRGAAIAFYQTALEAGAAGADRVRAWNALVGLHRARQDVHAEIRVELDAAADERTGESAMSKAARLVAAADLMRRRVRLNAEAIETFEAALLLDPQQMGALDALEAMAEADHDLARQEQVLARKVAASAKRPAQQKAILARLARLQAEGLGRPDAAREAYERALAIDPELREARRFLMLEARSRGDVATELANLERLVVLAPDPDEPDPRAADLVRLAHLLTEADRTKDAEDAARRALEYAPRHPSALLVLDELYTRAGRIEALVELLLRRAEAAPTPEAAVDILSRRATLLEAGGRDDEAIAGWTDLTERAPGTSLPWTRLLALYRQRQNWRELADTLLREADHLAQSGDNARAEAAYVEAAHLLHDRLAAPDRARMALERALDIQPGSRLALSGLLAQARAADNWAEEDRLLGRLLLLSDGPEARAQGVLERVRARQARGDLDGAVALVDDLDLATTPEGLLRLRVEIDEARDRLPAALPALEALRRRAVDSGDGAGERWALKRLARLASTVGPSPATEALLRRAVELDPDDREAARALLQLERSRGDDRALLGSLERMLATARRTFEGGAREAELLVEMASAFERLGRPADAERALRQALDTDASGPSSSAAWKRLGRWAAERNDHPSAVEAFGRATLALDADEQALYAESLARVGEWTEAARMATVGAVAAPRRAWFLEKAGDEMGAILLWRTVGGAEARAEVARLERRRAQQAFLAGRSDEARRSALEVLACVPDDEEALGWLIGGGLGLLEELAARLSPADAALVYRHAAPRLEGDDARVAWERAAALRPDPDVLVALAEHQPSTVAAAGYREALALDPMHAGAALGLARVGAPEEAAWALASVRDQASDRATRARLGVALGHVLRDRLQEWPDAREAFRRAADDAAQATGPEARGIRTDALRSLAPLERATGQASAAEETLETLRHTGEASEVDLALLAELYVERLEWLRALDVLRALPTSELFLRCLDGAGHHTELVDLLESEAARKMPEEARSLYLRAAEVAYGSLADPARAVSLLERALPLGPSDAELWSRLGQLYHVLGDNDRAARSLALAWAADHRRTELLLPLGDYHLARDEHEPAVDYFQKAVAAGVVPATEAPRIYLLLADHFRRLEDDAAEEGALKAALAQGAAGARRLLLAFYRRRKDGSATAAMLRQLLADGAATDRAALLAELAPLADAAEQPALDEELLRLEPDNHAARSRLLDHLRTSGQTARLAEELAKELSRSTADEHWPNDLHLGAYAAELAALGGYHSGDSDADLALIARLVLDAHLPKDARLQLLPLAVAAHRQTTPSRALAFFAALRTAGLPAPHDAADERALLRADHRFAELVTAIDRELGTELPPAERAELAEEAASLCAVELGRADEAARRYSALADQYPARRDFAERARTLYTAAGEPLKALSALAKEMKLARPDEQPQLKIARGELLLLAGAHAEAEAEFLHALMTTPRVGRAHAALADVHKHRGDLAGALEHLIAAAESPDLEPARAARCAIDAADVLMAEGDTATAERLYHLAANLDPTDRAPLDGLLHMAAAKGEPDRQVELLAKLITLIPERKERAHLHLQRARLYQLELPGHEVDAYRALKESVACDPELLDAVRALREAAEARGEWALAADQLYRELSGAGTPVARAELHVTLGRIYEERLLDGDQALRNFEAAAEALPPSSPLAPWSELVRLYTNAQRPADAALALDRWSESLDVPGKEAARAEVLERAGQAYERLGEQEAARARLQLATSLGGEAGRRADEVLLRLAGQAGDPIELRRRLEAKLQTTEEGQERVEILRRLLELAAQAGDTEEVERRASEVLSRAPGDPVAFIEKKRLLEQRGDFHDVAILLRERAAATTENVERAERLFQAGRLAERLGDVSTAGIDYEAALVALPDHVAALDALADLAYRSRQLQRARTLYRQLAARSTQLAPDELLRRRAELAEDLSDLEEARALYGSAAAANPDNIQVQEALARLALSRNEDAVAYQALRAVLDLLPLDSVDRITELRRQLGRLAFKLGERDAARSFFELVMSQDPRADVLEQLVVLYIDEEAWEEAADAYLRLSFLADRADRRAELLFRRGEILRLGLDDNERANDAYLKAADLNPRHAGTLRRLVQYYYREGDLTSLAEVVRELEQLGAGLEEAAVEVGLGLALGGDEARGTVVVAVAQPSAERLVEALVHARPARRRGDVAGLDPALRAAKRALGGGETGRVALREALWTALYEKPSDLHLRLCIARIYDLANDVARARLHYGVLSYVDPMSPAATRLRELGPATPLPIPDAARIHPSAAGALRDALAVAGPHILGLPPAPIQVEAAPEWAEKVAPLSTNFGLPAPETWVVADLAEPAWAEPTRPPRLLLSRRVVGDEAAVRFAAARALSALSTGVSLIEGRTSEDVAALLKAAATMFLPDLGPMLLRSGAFVQAWRAELEALPLRPESFTEPQRAQLEIVLAACVLDGQALASGQAYCVAERKSADRTALALTGDLRAALWALGPPEAVTPEARAAALVQSPPLLELIRFAAEL